MEELQEEFRFNSKKEYEDEIKRLISAKSSISKKKKKNQEMLDETYELLIEEYLRFCAKEDGQ